MALEKIANKGVLRFKNFHSIGKTEWSIIHDDKTLENIRTEIFKLCQRNINISKFLK
jgi:hypothetical protein